MSRNWPSSVFTAVDVADYRREYGLFDDAHYFLNKSLVGVTTEEQPGRERLFEEIAWTHVYASGDPVEFSRMPPGLQKEQARTKALNELTQSESYIRQALAIKLRTTC